MNMHSDKGSAGMPKPTGGVTIYWDKTGPLLRYEKDTLCIEDLNPQLKVRWRMSRGDMVRIGLRCLWAAITA
jgi:hypothetical protein